MFVYVWGKKIKNSFLKGAVTMQYKPLGKTGLYVSEITLGGMTFSDSSNIYGKTIGATGQELATRMVDVAIEAGINCFDTANMYSFGLSEKMLTKALGNRRKDVVVSTKCYFPFGKGPNDLGTSRPGHHARS